MTALGARKVALDAPGALRNVQDIDLGGFIPSPGFTIRQNDQPPVLTITFEHLKTAERCASSMREIIAKATEIIGRD